MGVKAWRLYTEQGVEAQVFIVLFVMLTFSGSALVSLFPYVLLVQMAVLVAMTITPFPRVGGYFNSRYVTVIAILLVFAAYVVWQTPGAFDSSITMTYARRFLLMASLLVMVPRPEVSFCALKGCKYYSIVVAVSIVVANLISEERTGGLVGNYHQAGMMMSIACILFLIDYFLEGGRVRDVLGFGLAMAALFMSGKRMYALLAVMAFIALYVIMRKREGAANPTRLVGVGLAAIGVMSALLPPMRALVQRMALFGQGEFMATSGRNQLWAMALDIFGSHSLTGIGFGNFAVYIGENYTLENTQPFLTHNIYLGLLAETGVIGLGLVLVFMALAFFESLLVLRRARSMNDGIPFYVMAYSVVMQLWFMVDGLTDNPLYTWHELFFYLSAVAMMLAVSIRLSSAPESASGRPTAEAAEPA
ncbi:MAG TPA: O-antigen ligase family protein [Coriobacteriia bacterium]|nr:O-antigen ligase family protein [Coriobacteriia bacterium]